MKLKVRSVLVCESEFGVCQHCYGRSLATNELAAIGEAVGHVAAQSIGEPGTQLTMRTFHTGGVAGADITHGLPRVVELFEARKPKGQARIVDAELLPDREYFAEFDDPANPRRIHIVDDLGEEAASYPVSRRMQLTVKQGDRVYAGDQLYAGPLNPHDLLQHRGPLGTSQYLVGEVQKVYKSQGVEISDKHIELIARQMTKRVRVDASGDTHFLPGQTVDKIAFERENAAVVEAGLEPATYEVMIMGITKASLATESFLSAASFQETTKVLTDAALEGKTDYLRGLKENVIIGKLIPAATGLRRYRNIEVNPVRTILPDMEGFFGAGAGQGDGGHAGTLTPEQALAMLSGDGGPGDEWADCFRRRPRPAHLRPLHTHRLRHRDYRCPAGCHLGGAVEHLRFRPEEPGGSAQSPDRSRPGPDGRRGRRSGSGPLLRPRRRVRDVRARRDAGRLMAPCSLRTPLLYFAAAAESGLVSNHVSWSQQHPAGSDPIVTEERSCRP